MPSRARALPLATLVAVVATLAALRVFERHAPRGPLAIRTASAVVDAGAPCLAREADGGGESHVATRVLHEDARHTHRARGVRGPTREHVGWTAHLSGPIEAQVVTSPDESTLYAATLAGDLVALRASDGSVAWTVPLDGRAYATPCVNADGTVYAGSDAKRVVAVTPAGAVRWRLEVDGEADTACVFAKDGTIVFAAGASVYGVRPGGDVAWRFQAANKVFTAPALEDDGTIVFGSQDDHVYALTPSGARAWSTDLGSDVDGAPAIEDDGDVVVGDDAGEVVRLHAADGSIVWRSPLGGYVRGPLSLARDGSVLAGVYGPTPRMVRLSTDGTVVASVPIRGTGARELGVHGGALEDASGALFFGGQDDLLRAVGPGGAWQWTHLLRSDVDAPMTLLERNGASGASGNGALVIADDAGDVTLFVP